MIQSNQLVSPKQEFQIASSLSFHLIGQLVHTVAFIRKVVF